MNGYEQFLKEENLTDEQIRPLVENKSDLIEIEENRFYIDKSEIEGSGIFAKTDLWVNDIVGQALINDKRTQLGRWTNHSDDPNCKMEIVNNGCVLVTLKPIKKGEELTTDYRKNKEIAKVYHVERLLKLETEMKKHEQIEIGIKHYFAPGCYAREMFVPQGVMLTGKIHRFGHLNIMSKGKMTLVTETGRQVVEAPFTFISEPGAIRGGVPDPQSGIQLVY